MMTGDVWFLTTIILAVTCLGMAVMFNIAWKRRLNNCQNKSSANDKKKLIKIVPGNKPK